MSSSSSSPSSSSNASTPERVRIRVRSGQNEAEIEADRGRLREAIELIPEILKKFPSQRADVTRGPSQEPLPGSQAQSQVAAVPVAFPPQEPQQHPTITVEKGDSLSDIVSKCFSDPWGKNPRKLSEVREVLQSYGLNYPKQSVAVALLRLAKGSKIRRFKSDGGEYVYITSTSMMMTAPQPPVDSSLLQLVIMPGNSGDVAEPAIEDSANV